MKLRIIILPLLVLISLNGHADCIQNPSSPIDRMGQNFVESGTVCWDIDLQSSACIRFDYDIDLENEQGSLFIYEVNSNGVVGQAILSGSGYESGTVNTSIPSGKAKVVYVPTAYTEFQTGGFIISFHLLSTKEFSEYTVRAEQLVVGDKLGLGVDNPTAQLHMSNGNIKTNSTNFTLSAPNGSMQVTPNASEVYFYSTAPYFRFNKPIRIGATNCGISYSGTLLNGKLHLVTNNQNQVTITKIGNIGVGTITPQYKLDVAGDIRSTGTVRADSIKAKDILVSVSNGADFVFDAQYNLLPLNELRHYISTNRHLPDIQSEKDMQDNGVNMNQFQIQLLKKIEELTLYIIKQDERIKELEAKSEK